MNLVSGKGLSNSTVGSSSSFVRDEEEGSSGGKGVIAVKAPPVKYRLENTWKPATPDK